MKEESMIGILGFDIYIAIVKKGNTSLLQWNKRNLFAVGKILQSMVRPLQR